MGIITYLIFFKLNNLFIGNTALLFVIALGSVRTLREALQSLFARKFGIDYVAIAAIVIGVWTHEYLVAAVVVLMVSGGKNLEEYGESMAKSSLKVLIDHIPTKLTRWKNNSILDEIKIQDVVLGDEIYIKRGEVVGLDGVLISAKGEFDESSLTGEPNYIEKLNGDYIRSGTVNVSDPLVIKVTKTQKDSTYSKIVEMVKKAQEEQSPMIRLADKYSVLFTVVTFSITVVSYLVWHDISRVLAVLAVATPCPLIIATPIALLGGINSASKKKIIIKNLSAVESLSRIDTILFDKTGTITLGTPRLNSVEVLDKSFTKNEVLSIASSIERSSLHPLAKAVVESARNLNLPRKTVVDINEKVGTGITGVINGQKYFLTKRDLGNGMQIELKRNSRLIAILTFEDQIKEDSQSIFKYFLSKGFVIKILTGDKFEAANKIIRRLNLDVEIVSECTPEDKQLQIRMLKKTGKTIAMVGDGINDAPALALADVGIAFSNNEQTAASDASDVILLGGKFSMVVESLKIAQKSISIAKQSIFWGMGLSILAMFFAGLGLISPITGAALQEFIDVAVILNSLRASK